MSTSEKPPRESQAPLPTFEEQPQPEDADPHGEAATQEYYADDQPYDEHGQPYAEEEQPYDEHGQPYAEEEQQYDEHGQPYPQEGHYAEQGHYEDNAPTAQIDAYPTVPTFTGQPGPPSSHHLHLQQPAPFSRRPLGPPPSQGGPYRIPIAPEPPTVPQAWRPIVVPAKPRPILGGVLAVYGILLWTFVVAGQFATSWITGSPMNNGTALFIVAAAMVIAWALAIRRSGAVAPATTRLRSAARGILTLFLANVLFWVTVLIATIIGQTASRNHDFAIAFFLVLVGAGATALGPRLTMPMRPELTHGARFAVVSMWIVGALVTFIAGAELATNG